jgi:DNA repair photolyase
MAVLSRAGVPTGVAVAPLIPGLNDGDVTRILRRAREAGASHAFLALLRLPAEVLPVFRVRLAEAFPDRARRVFAALAEMRGGHLRDARFGERMRGSGPRWEALARLFELQCRRLGLEAGDEGRGWKPLLPPVREHQGELFDPPSPPA